MNETDHKFFYKEVLPNPSIDHLVFGFFEFSIESDSPEPIPHEVFPDGCVSILYRCNKRLNLEFFLVKGLSLETFHTEVFGGDMHWGLKFSPVASAEILRCDPKDIPTQPVLDDKLLPHLLAGVSEQLSKCETFEDAVRVYTERLEGLEIPKAKIDKNVARAIEIIREKKGEVKIAEIAESLEIGRRQLERRFRKCSGITPKQLARTYRLRATAINLLEKDMNWANRAAEMGFSDQSHLSHELETLTGRSPKSFKERIKHVDHQDLIK
jgi:AraC-like DNA-binding protein